jgi:N-acetylmuramoyl-L-alanine amidase
VTVRILAFAFAVNLILGGLGWGSLPPTIATAFAAEPIPSHRLPSPKPQAKAPVIATDARIGGDDQQTRFVMDLGQRVDLAVFTLADPYRVIVDLPEVMFKLPPHTGEHGRGLVNAFRYGLIMHGGSRIVLDTKGPVRVDKAFILEPSGDQPARFVLDLSRTDRDSFMRNIALESRPSRAALHPNEIAPKDDHSLKPLIVLDPGHGGIDTGTNGLDGQKEKDIVLAFALTLRDKLLDSGKFRVAMTRDDDNFIPLNERVRFARNRKAALFVSIHADSVPRREGQAEGASVYTLSEKASDAEAAAIAEAENKSDALAGVDLAAEPDDVANILIDLAQRETKTFSLQFAHGMISELKNTARLHKHPLKSAGFVVLKAPDVPSVLVELGYMSTLKLLTSADWRSRTAGAMAQAVDTFFSPRLAGTAARGH